MLDNITLGQIGIVLAFVLGLWTTVETIVKKISKLFDEILDKKLQPIKDKLDNTDKNATMNYLVRCLDDMDRDIELSSSIKRRFYDQYEHYIDDLKSNGYIKDSVEKLKKEGKL